MHNWRKRHGEELPIFKKINWLNINYWLNINDRFSQCVLSSVYKFFTVKAQDTLMKLIFLLNSVNKIHGHLFKSCSGPSLWNKLSIEIKRMGSTNSFEHNVKNQ